MNATHRLLSAPQGSRWVLAAILAVAAWFRLADFDLMEFKYDEVAAVLLAKQWLACGIPQYGMPSGVGVVNPPGFMFFLCPLVAVTSSPLAIGLAVALVNIAGVYLLYRLGAAMGRPGAGLWGAAFMACHPWLILYSRKIWAQSLLPALVAIFLLLVLISARHARSRAVFFAGPVVALAWQLHYSAYSLVFVCVAWLARLAWRGHIHRAAALAGALAGLILMTPYLHHLAADGFADARQALAVGQGGPSAAGAWSTMATWASSAFALGIGLVFAARPVSLAIVLPAPAGEWLQACAAAGTAAVLALAGYGLALGLGRRRWSGGGDGAPALAALAPWLAALVALPPLLYAVRGIASPPHYFVVSLPALLLLAGVGMDGLMRRGGIGGWRVALWAGLIPCLCGAAVWTGVIRCIARNGGSGGDYGPAYRAQRAAARVLAAGGAVPGSVDMRRCRDLGIGVRYIMENELRVPAQAGKKAALADRLLFPDAACGSGDRVESGPFLICWHREVLHIEN